MRDEFMTMAIRLARDKMRAGCGGPFGAVIVRQDQVIARGWNRVTSTNDPTAHAEVCAIRAASRKLKTFHLGDCELYTSCEPCPMCLAAIYWARIRTVYFGASRTDAARVEFDDDRIYRELARPLSRRSLPMRQMHRPAAVAVFDEWVVKPDKIRY